MVDNISLEISVVVGMLLLVNEIFGCCCLCLLKILLYNIIKELFLFIFEGYVIVFYFLVIWYVYG